MGHGGKPVPHSHLSGSSVYGAGKADFRRHNGGRGWKIQPRRRMDPLRSVRTDDAAGDHGAGISGGLSLKVVGVLVDDDGAVQNIFNGKTLVIKAHPGVALVCKKRRHVSGMVWMETARRAIVPSGFCKASGAVPVFMDMHGIEAGRAGSAYVGKIENFCFHQNSPVRGMEEFHEAADVRVRDASPDPGQSSRGAV